MIERLNGKIQVDDLGLMYPTTKVPLDLSTIRIRGRGGKQPIQMGSTVIAWKLVKRNFCHMVFDSWI